jgi:Ca2+-binding RTX toxin-like protein
MTRSARPRLGAVLAVAAGAVLAGAVPAHATDPVTITLGSGALTVTGDDTANVIALRLLAGDTTHLVVDVGNDGSADATLARSGFDHIDIDANGDDDTVLIDDANGTFTDTETTTIDGGKGADTLTGGAGGEIIDGRAGADVIDAGGGDDTVTGGDNLDTIDLGAGADRLQWTIGDDLDTVDGGTGTTTVAVTGSDAADQLVVSPTPTGVLVEKGNGATAIDLTGFSDVELTPLGGADRTTVELVSSADVGRVSTDLGTDGAADTVEVDGSSQGDSIMIDGRAGDVDVTSIPGPSVDITGTETTLDQLLVEGRDGEDVIGANGLAADTLELELRGGDLHDFLVGGDGDDTLRGGGADDTLVGGPGTDTLDGGTGTNTLIQ